MPVDGFFALVQNPPLEIDLLAAEDTLSYVACRVSGEILFVLIYNSCSAQGT